MDDPTASEGSQRVERDRDAGRARRDPADASPALEWLLLTHHLPPQPAYLRVKVRRRLERIGAVPLKNSVYVLPCGEETQEDFEWLRQEIEDSGGESTLSVARFLDGETAARLVSDFREASDAGYAGVIESARAVLEGHADEQRSEGTGRFQLRSKLTHLRRVMSEVIGRDFFAAPGRAAAERALAELEAAVRGDLQRRPEDFAGEDGRPVGRTWVTRRGVKEDRIACAWLIRRFIDPAAVFKFVRPHGYRPVDGELTFDMYEGEFTHEGDGCTFETLLARFGLLADPALVAVGEIVHDIDLKDEKFGRPETAGVASLIDGVTRLTDDDDERLKRGGALFEQLFEHFRAVS